VFRSSYEIVTAEWEHNKTRKKVAKGAPNISKRD
jgi:hypothetical protein